MGFDVNNRIFFVGDPHGQWERIVPVLMEHRPAATVLLGDMELVRPLHDELAAVIAAGIEIYWIPGNHDGDEPNMFDCLFNSDLSTNNLSGSVREVCGLNVAGLGGVFRQKIWNPKIQSPPRHRDRNSLRHSAQRLARDPATKGVLRDGIPFRHHVAIWPEDYETLRRKRADILVLHEAPECHPFGFRTLGELAEAMKVRLVIHGHHHQNYRGTTECGVPVIGVSLAGIIDQDGELIAPGLESYPVTRKGD